MSLASRINDVLAGLMLLAEPSAIDYGRVQVSQGSGGHGKHGTTTVAPTDMKPLVLDWATFFSRALDLAERDLAVERGQVEPAAHPRTGRVASGPSQERHARIVRSPIYRGRPATFVAYLEGVTEDHVRRARSQARLDAGTGEPLPKPQTHNPLED